MRSVIFQFLTRERSQASKPGPRKMFRPIVPKVLGSGGVITLLPLAKQPNCCNWLGRACTAQAAFWVPSGKNGIGPEEDEVKSAVLPKKFQRSLPSPVKLISFPVSTTFQGCPVCKVTIEFTCQPCRS